MEQVGVPETMRRTLIIVCVSLAAAPWCYGRSYADGDFALKVEDKPPPEVITADVREKIAPKAYQVSGADGLFFEFWFVPELTLSEIGESTKKTLDNVVEISLLGAMIVHQEDHHDFRDDPIDPGTYVLRMALQPQDGDHLGTSPFDTYAILVPYDTDDELKEYADHDFMVELASEDTVAEHPAILALQPMNSGEGEFPRLHADEEEEWYSFCMKFPAKAGADSTLLPILVVFDGIGDIE